MKRIRRTVTSAERKKMVTLYRNGASKTEVAKHFKRSHSVVLRQLQLAGVVAPKKTAAQPVVPQYVEVTAPAEPPPVIPPRTIMQRVRNWFAGK